MAEKRKKVWIDRLQTLLSIRLALYFVIYQIAVWLLFLIGRSVSESLERLLGAGAGWVVVAVTAFLAIGLGGLFIWDAVRMLHRVVGPLVRFRRAIKDVAAGEEVTLIVLREGDHLQELKDDFNEMLEALERRGAVVLTPSEASRFPRVMRPAVSAFRRLDQTPFPRHLVRPGPDRGFRARPERRDGDSGLEAGAEEDGPAPER